MATADVRPRSNVLRVIVVALVVLALCELAVRARADALVEPQLWSSPEQEYKAKQIDALAARGGASVVAIGSSAIDAAFDATKLAGSAPRPAYNAGTGGSSMAMVAGWGEFEAVPRLKPDTVVLGITTREFNPNDPQQAVFTRDFLASRAYRKASGSESALQVVERRAEDVSELFRYRTILRQPRYLENLIGLGDAPRDSKYALVNNAGQYINFISASYKNTPYKFKATALYKWELGAEEQATLTKLLRYLTTHVKHVLVVSMPITPVYVGWSPGGQADIDAVNALVRRQVDAAGAQFLDAGIWPTEFFADAGHVNGAGSARFMETINAELQRLGWR